MYVQIFAQHNNVDNHHHEHNIILYSQKNKAPRSNVRQLESARYHSLSVVCEDLSQPYCTVHTHCNTNHLQLTPSAYIGVLHHALHLPLLQIFFNVFNTGIVLAIFFILKSNSPSTISNMHSLPSGFIRNDAFQIKPATGTQCQSIAKNNLSHCSSPLTNDDNHQKW